jgi:hypothetical protein
MNLFFRFSFFVSHFSDCLRHSYSTFRNPKPEFRKVVTPSVFFFLFLFFSACKTETGKCKFGDPIAIFSDTMQMVKKHHFEVKDKTGIEFVTFKNGMLLEVEQSGCNTITQQYTFEIMGGFSKMDDAFWKVLAIKNFTLLATFSPKLTTLGAWAQAISSVQDKMKLAEPFEVDKGIFVRLDKVVSADRAMLVVQLSQ